ncbi:MAG: PIN domain-containing protein [Deltaproteobacteria bacterium]|nr:PIN domain-containing protein [Deltaproteobacteria bacterium]
MGEAFFDTNVLLYLLSEDARKADRAEEVVAGGGVISVQVLNEFASVAVRKLRMTYPEVRDALAPLRTLCAVEPLTPKIHDLGLDLAERFGFSVYDALIVASALQRCDTLYSEDLQDGQRIDGHLVIRNPFREGSHQPLES